MATCVVDTINVTRAGQAALNTLIETIVDTKYIETIFVTLKNKDVWAVIVSKT